MRVGLFDCPSGLQPAHDDQEPLDSGLEPAVRAWWQPLGAKRHRHIKSPSDFEARELARRDADDLVRVAAEREPPANRRGVAAEFRLPESVADHHFRRAARRLIVRGREHTAQQRPDAEHSEEVAAHQQRRRESRLVIDAGQADAARAPGEHAGERFLPTVNLFPDRIRRARAPDAEIAARALHVGDTDLGQLVRRLDRKRPQAHGVEQLEERTVGPDPERQRQHRHDGEGRIAPERPRGMPQVLNGVLEQRKAPSIADRFFDRFHAAQPEDGLSPRLDRRQPGPYPLVGVQRQMAFDLVGQLALAAAAADDVQQTEEEGPETSHAGALLWVTHIRRDTYGNAIEGWANAVTVSRCRAARSRCGARRGSSPSRKTPGRRCSRSRSGSGSRRGIPTRARPCGKS